MSKTAENATITELSLNYFHQMDLELLEKTILLLNKHSLSEISYQTESISLCLKKESLPKFLPQITTSPAPAEISSSPQEQPQSAAPATTTSQHIPVKSTLIGTFYRATDPEAAPLCQVGQKVKKGAPICLIEAMKVITLINSPCDGTILEICVENGQIIEFDQVLMTISPAQAS